jgi:PAS domain S-box-containing protein
MPQSLQIHARALERFEVPVVRVGSEAEILYANKAMLDLLGTDTYAGLKVRDWLADSEDWGQVEQELTRRLKGEASTYELKAKRVGRSEPVPVAVFAVPEVDAAGNITGSIAFVTNLLESQVQRAMHEAIETRRTGEEILRELDNQLGRLLTYDNLRVTVVSRARGHLRTLYSTRPNPGGPLRWWPMPPFVRQLIDEHQAKSIDLEGWFNQRGAEQVSRDPRAIAFRKEGYKHTLSIPVKQEEETIAFISLDTKQDRPFAQSEIDLCTRLPLAEGTLMALHYEEAERSGALIDLIRDLNAGFAGRQRLGARPAALPGHIQRAAKILVNRLATHFKWQHVSIFRYDERADRLWLLQQASDRKFRLKRNYSIPASKGLVGKAFRTGQIVNVGNVKDRAQAPEYVVGVKGILSELCVPVPGHPIRWVVNIESQHENAFVEEEISTVEMLVREAGNILERAALLEMRHAVLASVNDAVIESNSAGVIRRVNPAASHLLGRKRLVGKKITDFLVNEEAKAAVERAASFSRMEGGLLRRPEGGRQEQVRVMISGAELPTDLGGKVFVLSDLTYHKELKRLDLIKEVFRQAALETRIPLALAASYLAQATRDLGWAADGVDRILKQLRKADLPLERLLRLAGDGDERHQFVVPVDLKEMLESTIRELPAAEQVQIDCNGRGSALVRVPRESLSFCIESMLSFALRTRPPNKKVALELERERGWAKISVKGNWPVVLDSSAGNEITGRWRRKAIEDLTLARDVLAKVAERSGGSFHGRLDKTLALDLRLPVDSDARA